MLSHFLTPQGFIRGRSNEKEQSLTNSMLVISLITWCCLLLLIRIMRMT